MDGKTRLPRYGPCQLRLLGPPIPTGGEVCRAATYINPAKTALTKPGAQFRAIDQDALELVRPSTTTPPSRCSRLGNVAGPTPAAVREEPRAHAAGRVSRGLPAYQAQPTVAPDGEDALVACVAEARRPASARRFGDELACWPFMGEAALFARRAPIDRYARTGVPSLRRLNRSYDR
jgi:hypothetical protein